MNRLIELLVEFARRRYVVSVQNPVRLDGRSKPQPDLALLRRPDFYGGSPPTPEDVLLLVEVSESTSSYDRSVKLPIGIAPLRWLFRTFGVSKRRLTRGPSR